MSYSDSYLLDPLQLLMQVELQPSKQKASVKLDISQVDICMQKSQLINICRLIELDHEYSEMQDAYQMQ
jgi:hypothetical protein